LIGSGFARRMVHSSGQRAAAAMTTTNAHFLDLELAEGASSRKARVAVNTLVIAGWTGRDKAALEKHIRELEELGIARPATTPIYYRAAARRLTTADRIEATGTSSSGEVEFVLVQWEGQLWVGVGSDHTDREVEKYNITVSKQMCDKPVGTTFWRYEDVADHWDSLVLRSFIRENGKRVLYQEGALADMLDPKTLIANRDAAGRLPDGTLMFGGTFAARGGIRPADRFDFELEDPVLGRKIAHGYDIATLPAPG
jgi:hypothetical protein